MALLVEHPIDWMLDHTCWILFDLGHCHEFFVDEPAQVVGVIGGISDDMADALQPLDQAACLRAVAPLSWRDLKADRQAEGVDGGMDLRRQSAFGSSDGVSFKPPF